MGLSVAISGGIILTVFVLLLLSLPGLTEKMFSIGDITTQVTQHEQKISNTEISMNYLSQLVGSSKVNFTLNNDGAEKLWNFEDFDLFIEYDGAISGQTTQQLSYNGECLGTVPPAGNWCVQSISNDVADPKILNSGEEANIRTNLSENLASTTAIITLVTDNGVTFTTARDLITTKTSGTTLTTNEEIILVNPSTTAFTLTLPTVNGNTGKHYLIKYVATTGTTVTIDGNGAETINGQPTVKLEYPYSSWDLYTDGSAWYADYNEQVLPKNKQIIIEEEWLSGLGGTSVAVAAHGIQGWTMTGVGTETGLQIDSEADHAGIKRIGTGGGNGDDANIWLSNVITTQIFSPSDIYDMTWIVRIPTITTVVARAGLTVTPTSNSEEAAENTMFAFTSTGDASWTCRTRSAGGVDQTNDSTVDVVANTWYKLRIVKDDVTVRFFINDVNYCNHALQVPTNVLTPFATVDTSAAVVRTLDLDYFRGSFTLDAR